MAQHSPKQMVLVGFIQASNCSNYPGSWRHPDGSDEFLLPQYYQHIARTLEAGKFHLAFVDDRLAMPDRYEDSFAATVEHGIRTVKLDLGPVVTAMALATERIGIGATYSTTYHTPFHVARLFATLDHFSGGRIAWNVVTSLNDSEALNFGEDAHLPHDVRYDRADEFMEAAFGLWDTWDEGALILDRAPGRFADPSRVRRLDHSGEWFKSRGPLTVPRCPQGRPVIIQAGQSGRGREFAARWGELVFVIVPTLENCRAFRRDIREKAAALGRNPDTAIVSPAVYVVVDSSEEKAREKLAELKALAHPMDSVVLLSEVFNYDFSAHHLDESLSDAVLDSISGLRGFLNRVTELSGTQNPTVQDFIRYSGRGTLDELPTFVGNPAQVADEMEGWFRQGACDGFVVAATHIPGAYEDFAWWVVPELQQRGLFRSDYQAATLRQDLGLPELNGIS